MTIKSSNSYYDKHSVILEEAVKALGVRDFYSPFPEHPRAYAESADADGKEAFGKLLNQNFTNLHQGADSWIGEEVSPYWQMGLGISYPSISVDQYILNATKAQNSWSTISVNERAGLLVESLARVKARFFELAYATMHTTGQSFMMGFQASGPHANDRALEAIAMGLQELNRFPKATKWSKPMGKFNLEIDKTWIPVPRGINLVVGCSTFPTWNTVPGLYAGLVTGNTVIVKPHPKAILPIAIFIEELKNVMQEAGLDTNIVQLAVDTLSHPITKQLAEHPEVKLIDYTGGNVFGDYLESLSKITFTEKAGVNSVIIDSVDDIKAVVQNIAFSASLYSGQMCTAPQNIFIAKEIATKDGVLSFEDVAEELKNAIEGIVNNPKMAAGTLGAIQNGGTTDRIQQKGNFEGEVLLETSSIVNEEFENARTASPKVVVLNQDRIAIYAEECFGPVVFLIQTENTDTSIALAAKLAKDKGAITCLAFTTSEETKTKIAQEMNKAFTPVSFNLSGAAFVNQHAAFSDFHVTGGNPAGNASFTNPSYINNRFVWVGNRYM